MSVSHHGNFTWKIAAGLAAVYLIWGSTYLAIRYAVQTIPPYLMSGSRFILAGLVLYMFARYKSKEKPTAKNWISASIAGAILLLGANGSVSWASTRVPSAITALMLGMVPVWMVLLDWLWQKGPRPTLRVSAGIVFGFAGTGLLVTQGNFSGIQDLDPLGTVALLFAALAWATGSLYSRGGDLPASPILATAMQMLAGGVLLVIAGLSGGELQRLDPAGISGVSLFSVFYLFLFGAIIAFSCYVWLLRVAPAALVATYAYVNPVIAVFLGWSIAGEIITSVTLVATGVIVMAVILITIPHKKTPLPSTGKIANETSASEAILAPEYAADKAPECRTTV